MTERTMSNQKEPFNIHPNHNAGFPPPSNNDFQLPSNRHPHSVSYTPGFGNNHQQRPPSVQHQEPPRYQDPQNNSQLNHPPSAYQQNPAQFSEPPQRHQPPPGCWNSSVPQQASQLRPPPQQPSQKHQLPRYQQPPGHPQPPQGHQQPPQGFPQPPGHQQPQPRYIQPPGYNQPSPRHQQPPHGHQQPPHGHQQSPHGHQQPPHGHQQPPRHQQPPPIHQQTTHRHQQPPHGIHQPPGHQKPPENHEKQFNNPFGPPSQTLPLRGQFHNIPPQLQQPPPTIHNSQRFQRPPAPQSHEQTHFGSEQNAGIIQQQPFPQPIPPAHFSAMPPTPNIPNYGPVGVNTPLPQSSFQQRFQGHNHNMQPPPFPPTHHGNVSVNTAVGLKQSQSTMSMDCTDSGSVIGLLRKFEKDKRNRNKQIVSRKEEKKPKKCLLWKHIQNLAEIKRGLKNASECITKMELDVTVADNKTWDSHTQLLESHQSKVKDLLPFLDKAYTDEQQGLIKSAQQKRARNSKSKRLKYEQRQLQRAEWEAKSKLIDEWQEQKNRKFREKTMKAKRKAAADLTLAKVTKEIHDANKLVETMVALEKLRLIRRDAAEKRGDADIGESRQSFEQKISDMTRLVKAQLEHYKEEETRLKAIIKSEVEESDRKLQAIKKEAEQFKQESEDTELHTLLFGAQNEPQVTDPLYPFVQYYKQGETNFQAFLQIRHEWDSYLVPDCLAGGSAVPSGWLLPEEPSNGGWAKFQL